MSAGWNDALQGVLPGTTGNLDLSSAAKPAGSAGLALGTGTGQHGVVPLVTSIGEGAQGVVNQFWHFINDPFTEDLPPLSLVQIIGTIFIVWFLWTFIMYHVRIAGEVI